MTLYDALQAIFNTISAASIYALVGVGFTLIFGVTRVFNVAYADLLGVGSYMAFLVVPGFAISFVWGFPFAVLSVGVLYIILERVVFRGTYSLPITGFLVSLGLARVLQDLVAFTAQHHREQARLPVPGYWHIGTLFMPYDSFIVIGGTLLLLIALTIYLERTRSGMAIRAIAQDGELAGLMGVPVGRYVTGVFLIGGMLAGAGGSFVSLLGAASPSRGSDFLLQGLVVALVGGLGSVRGALISAFVVATFESLIVWSLVWVQLEGWLDVIEFGAAVIFLLIRPQGIIGGVTSPIGSSRDFGGRTLQVGKA